MIGCSKNSFNEILADALERERTRIKPCPFCGNLPRLQRDSRWPRSGPHEGERVDAFEVVCDNYGCPIYHSDNVYFLSEQDAVDAWNRRTGDEPL